ncbi:MAG: hypothetical protein HZY79_15515 [Rhodoblastus sp.]|nr:MAG: hypothetical protein HZY79_15515 [Rhodoblastus sp.]
MAKRPHARSLLIALCAALCAAGAAIAQPQYPSPTLGEATRVMRTPTGAPAPVDMIAKVMRRVDLDDYRLPGEGDYCAALQRAHDAIPGGAIHLPVGVVQLGTSSQACQIEWTRPIRLVGQGWSETHVSGSVIYIPAPPVGWNGAATFHVTSTAARGSVFSGFSIRQDQPPPAAGWTPTVYPPVWSLSNTAGGVIITDLLAAPVYDLVRADLSGRLEVSHIRGQVLHSVVAVDRSYDSDRYDAWHIWPYWSSHASVRDWQQSNLVAMTLGRVDTPFVDRIFMIWGRTLLAASGSANGVPSKIKAGALACDGCYKAVTVSANNVTGSIASLMWQGRTRPRLPASARRDPAAARLTCRASRRA